MNRLQRDIPPSSLGAGDVGSVQFGELAELLLRQPAFEPQLTQPPAEHRVWVPFLNRCGNRSLNSTIHMIAVTQARMHPPAIAYMERKQAGGMSYREALRCLKRQLARVVFKTMLRTERSAAGVVVTARFRAGNIAVAM